MPKQPRTIARRLLVAWISIALLGLFLLSAKAFNTASYDWKPVEIPLPSEVGSSASADFVAGTKAVYEVILEYDAVLPESKLKRLLAHGGENPAAEVSWSIALDGVPIALGDSSTFLYYSTGGRTTLGQIRRWLFSVPFHRGGGSAVQVIGRARLEPDRRYKVEVERTALHPSLEKSAPRLGLQLSRELWSRLTERSLIFAQVGFGLVLLAGLLFGLWLCVMGFAFLKDRRSAPASNR